MVSCSFVYLCCVMTPCFFLFQVLSHPYIPLHFFPFWDMIFTFCVLIQRVFPMMAYLWWRMWPFTRHWLSSSHSLWLLGWPSASSALSSILSSDKESNVPKILYSTVVCSICIYLHSNPRRACAARVTVLCLSVSPLLYISLYHSTNNTTYLASGVYV